MEPDQVPIQKDDLTLLCERFTTSKLKTFEDLSAIGTYGFRGEALASISHIAHLAVTTKTNESSCAWRALYSDGKLVPSKPGQSADPKPIAGRQGTQITVGALFSLICKSPDVLTRIQVEDLFYNIPTRRRAFRSASEEYAKILDLVGRYGVHCAGVAFSCKKHGESGVGISVPASASTTDRIRQIHGSAVANELVQFKASSERWGFKADGCISNANYSVKKTTFLLFINHRAVESSSIKKALEQTYSAFLPKGGHPFVYLSVEIEPHRVDVNVHPTKREVNFLHEDEIIEAICDDARTALGNVDTSRTFMTQTLLPNAKIQSSKSATPASLTPGRTETPGSEAATPRGSVRKTPRPYDNDLVRTDSKARKITSMLPPGAQAFTENNGLMDPANDMDYEHTDREPTLCRLKSIKELRAAVRENMHNELTDVFASHTFVGIVDSRKRIAAIQGGVKLYLVDYGMVSNEYFYQLGVTDFGNFGSIRFNDALDLKELLGIAANQEREKPENHGPVDWGEVVEVCYNQLITKRDMLAECFSLHISEAGQVQGIPLLMKGYMPPMTKLPSFLFRLGPFVNWEEEKPCFQSFLRELAAFYVPEAMPSRPSGKEETELDQEIAARQKHLARAIENVMFPAFKARLVATKGLLKGMVEIANLKGLYRVFERC